MTHAAAGHYASKHPRGTEVPEPLAEALQAIARNGCITCRQAHDVARRQNVSPHLVGVGLDLLELRITRCQLGLFGYSPGKKGFDAAVDVPAGLEAGIASRLTAERVACREAWDLAERLKCSKIAVAAVCDTQGVKIGPCQLGAF